MPKTVMVVDDSHTLRQVVSVTLVKAGYSVLEAVDGVDALEKLKQNDVNLIICDVKMPNMDGISFVKEIKGSQKHKFLPIIMLTTVSQSEQIKAGKEAGAKAWIVKPFKPDRILSAVEKLIR
jgi:two-component system chemotaxis response regulator CheY